MKYLVESEGGGNTIIEANSWKDAERQGAEWMREGEWPHTYVTMWITEECSCDGCHERDKCHPGSKCDVPDSYEGGDRESFEVEVGADPEPPDCKEGMEHDWQSPEWLGGCSQNPGVWGMGGTQIASTEVCANCGAYKKYTSESTPGNLPHEPEQYEYEEPDERSLAWIAEN